MTDIAHGQQGLQKPTFYPDQAATDLYNCCLRLFVGLLRSPTCDPSVSRSLRNQAQKFKLWGTSFDAHEGGLDKRIYGTERSRDLLLSILLGLGETLSKLTPHLLQDELLEEHRLPFKRLKNQVSGLLQSSAHRGHHHDADHSFALKEKPSLDSSSSDSSFNEVEELLRDVQSHNTCLYGLVPVLEDYAAGSIALAPSQHHTAEGFSVTRQARVQIRDEHNHASPVTPLPDSNQSPSLARLCSSIGKLIDQYINANQVPNEPDIERFRLEVQTLHKFLNLIERLRAAEADRSQVEDAHLRDVKRLLDRCNRILSKLFVSIREKTSETSAADVPWDLNAPNFSFPRVYISFFTRTLQMSMWTLNLIHRWKARMPRDSLLTGWGELSRSLQALHESVVQRRRFTGDGDQEECLEERGLLRDVEQCIASSEQIASSTGLFHSGEPSLAPFPSPPNGSSPWHLPIRHGSPISSSQPDSRTEDQASDDSDGESVDDPLPDVDFGFTAEAYESIINTLSGTLEREMSTEDYRRAEKTYKILEKRYVDRETNLEIPFNNRSELREKLGEIYLNQGRYRKAIRVLVRLLHEPSLEPDRKWRLSYLLARAYLGQRQLPKAESFARGSLTGRDILYGKEHPLTQESARLVISIYETQDDIMTAMGLRAHYCPQTIPPPPPKSVLRNSQRPKEVFHALNTPNIPPIPPSISSADSQEENGQPGNNHVKWAPDVWNHDGGINQPTQTGKTQLIDAIYNGDEEYVSIILRRKASVEATCVDDITPLMHAVINGHEGIVILLLEHGAKVDVPVFGWTALHKATDAGNHKIMKILLQCGADIESKSPFDFSPPMSERARLRAIANNEPNVEMTATPDLKEQTWTPLLRAASKGDEAAVRLLLDCNANIEARSPTSATPLIHACENLHFSTVDLLLMRGCDPHTDDAYGWKPLHRALVNRSADSVQLLQRLLDQGCEINARCNHRKTPLHYAVEKSNMAAGNFLLSRDADFEARDAAERTPLHTAIECRHESMVRLLLEHGADAAAKDQMGHDALAAANHADRKSPEIIALLGKHKKRMKKDIRNNVEGRGGGGSRRGSFGGARRESGEGERERKRDKSNWVLGKARPR